MLKFLPGILLIQLITLLLVIGGFIWADDPQLTIVIIVFGLIVGILSAFWFTAIAREMYKSAQAELHQAHSREREKILLNAEREKASIASESYRQIEKATSKAHTRANLKVGLACAGAAAAGGIMIFSQLVTVGMLILVASGSGLAGYLARARQERLPGKEKIITNDEVLVLDNKPNKLPENSANNQ